MGYLSEWFLRNYEFHSVCVNYEQSLLANYAGYSLWLQHNISIHTW